MLRSSGKQRPLWTSPLDSFASICDLSIAVSSARSPILPPFLIWIMSICMRKFGLIAAIVGLATLSVGLLLRLIANLDTWLWLPGIVLLTGGSGLLLWSRFAASAAAPAPTIPRPVG